MGLFELNSNGTTFRRNDMLPLNNNIVHIQIFWIYKIYVSVVSTVYLIKSVEVSRRQPQ